MLLLLSLSQKLRTPVVGCCAFVVRLRCSRPDWSVSRSLCLGQRCALRVRPHPQLQINVFVRWHLQFQFSILFLRWRRPCDNRLAFCKPLLLWQLQFLGRSNRSILTPLSLAFSMRREKRLWAWPGRGWSSFIIRILESRKALLPPWLLHVLGTRPWPRRKSSSLRLNFSRHCLSLGGFRGRWCGV